MLDYEFSKLCYVALRILIRIFIGKEKRNKIFEKRLISPSSFMLKDFAVISKNGIKAAVRKNTMDYQTLFIRDEDLISEIELNNDEIFVDIGANVGIYTLQVASKYPKNRIISIEALPEEFKALKRNIIDVNNLENVSLVNMGVFSNSDKITLYQTPIWTTASSAFVKSGKAIEIPCDTLDNIIQKLKSDKIFVIKMDIEGSEYDALIGASKTLQNCKKIIIEVHITDTMNREENMNRIKKILLENNFNLNLRENGYHLIGTKKL